MRMGLPLTKMNITEDQANLPGGGIWEFSFGNVALRYLLVLCLETIGTHKYLHYRSKLWGGQTQLEIKMEFEVMTQDKMKWL